MSINRYTVLFDSFVDNYWVYFRELEKEFMETQKYVEFCVDNRATFFVEYLKLFQAVCSEIDVVGKVLAKVVNPLFKLENRKNNIYKWWYEIQGEMLVTDGPFTYMNSLSQSARFSLLDYKCLLMIKLNYSHGRIFE